MAVYAYLVTHFTNRAKWLKQVETMYNCSNYVFPLFVCIAVLIREIKCSKKNNVLYFLVKCRILQWILLLQFLHINTLYSNLELLCYMFIRDLNYQECISVAIWSYHCTIQNIGIFIGLALISQKQQQSPQFHSMPWIWEHDYVWKSVTSNKQGKQIWDGFQTAYTSITIYCTWALEWCS